MNDIIVILKQVIAKHPEAMNDQDIIKPLLRKAFFHDKLSGNVLGLIFESGIVDIALLLGNIPAQRLKFYVDSFVNEFGMRPYIAKKYVIIWLQALDIEYEEYEDEEYDDDNDEYNDEDNEDNEDNEDDGKEKGLRIQDINSDQDSIVKYYGLTSKNGWLQLCNFLYLIYKEDMRNPEFNIGEFVNAVGEQLIKNDARNDYAFHCDKKSYYFGEGLRNLFMHHQTFMCKIIDYMLKQIQKLLQGKNLTVTGDIDIRINEWYALNDDIHYNVTDRQSAKYTKKGNVFNVSSENDEQNSQNSIAQAIHQDLHPEIYSPRKFLESLKSKKAKAYLTLLKMAQGKNGQEIADELGFSRENARRLKNDGIKKVAISLSSVFSMSKIKQQEYATIRHLREIYGNDDFVNIVLFGCKSDKVPFEYLDFAKVIVPQDKYGSIYEKIWQDVKSVMTNDDGEYKTLSEVTNAIAASQTYPYLNEGSTEPVKRLLIAKGYNVFNEHIFYKTTIATLCAPIVYQYFLDGITLNREDNGDIDKLRDICRKIYGSSVVENKLESVGSVSSALTKILVLCGKSRYISPENIKNKEAIMRVLEQVTEYIDKLSESDKKVTERRAYNIFAKSLHEVGIDNEIFLHGLLTYFYSDRYIGFNKGIKRRNVKGEPLEKRIERRVAEEPINKKDLMMELWTFDPVFSMTITSSEKLFFDGNGYVCSVDYYKYKSKDIEDLRCFINNVMEKHNGYCNGYLLMEQIKNSKNKFFEQFQDSDVIVGFASKVLVSEYKFSRPHILRKDIEINEINWLTVLLYMLGNSEKLTREEIIDGFDKIRSSYVAKRSTLRELQETFLRVSKNELLKKDSLSVDENVINSVERFIKGHMKNGFIAISKIEDSRFESLPMIKDISWNGFLLHSVVKYYLTKNYRIIEIAGIKWEYENGIIVDADSQIYDFVDLLVDCIKSRGTTRISGVAMFEILRKDFGLDFLPYEIRKGSKRLRYSSRMNAYLLEDADENDAPEPKPTLAELQDQLQEWLVSFSDEEGAMLKQQLRYCEPFSEYPELFDDGKGLD